MITDQEKEQLNQSAIEVFGTMYFTPVELLSEVPAKDSWRLEDSYVRTAIGFTGPLQARLCFYFPRSLAESIACGFLGLDPEELEEGKVIDTMRESANMIVGNFLGRLDPDGACALGIPEAETVTGFSPEALDGQVIAFVSDFGFLWLVYER